MEYAPDLNMQDDVPSYMKQTTASVNKDNAEKMEKNLNKQYAPRFMKAAKDMPI